MLLTIGAAVLVLGVLIFVHELGHFIAAKAVGVGVPRFSLGLGPISPLRWKRGETEYVISWIPFGGYVKMATAEDEDQSMVGALEGGTSEEKFPPEKLFENKPLWARILVIVAGVTMNVLFAWVVFSVLAGLYGGPEPTTPAIARVDSAGLPAEARPLADVPFGTQILRVNGDTMQSWSDVFDALRDVGSNALTFDLADREPITVAIPGGNLEARGALIDRIHPLQEPRIGSLVPGYPAATSGIQPGDIVVSAGSDTVRSWEEFVRAIEGHAGDTVSLRLLRKDSLINLAIVPVSESIKDPASGGLRETGRIGVSPPQVRYGPLASIREGGKRTLSVAGEVWFAVKGLVTGRISPKELGGPIQIGQLSGQVARMGIDRLFWFMAYFSVNLAILNLLPVPVLDGGHLMFLLIEGVRRRPLSLNLRLRLSQVGMVLLIGLMLFALSNDLVRVFSR
jgi:regulator of sigma E protease